ncbi:hypothetical protein ADICYQ_0781 [Cyclobacterium qasimii M12-11B]|uniref:Uncharacterized protein n=1 Tax=Cyclobacterium qasimii M12-11B TaxID=641524 RepID=S7VNL3_9BACT|nr:hypothetical protein ADICYQ_0781 [Cyclobacterium qasimii M12-11B]
MLNFKAIGCTKKKNSLNSVLLINSNQKNLIYTLWDVGIRAF